MANGHYRLILQGASAGVTYKVQTSTDLQPNSWSTLGNATADASGMLTFDDPSALQLHWFYRATWP
jgi:hypothetical protein